MSRSLTSSKEGLKEGRAQIFRSKKTPFSKMVTFCTFEERMKAPKSGEMMEKGVHSSNGKLVYCTEGHVIIKADIEKDGKIKKSDK